MSKDSSAAQPQGGSQDEGREAAANAAAERSAQDQAATDQAFDFASANEVQQANERALRAQAELENFRKRIRREMDDQLKYAALPLLRDLLPVIDNLERAMQAAEGAGAGTSQGMSGLLNGIQMVQAQLYSVLQQHHCKPIEAVGQPFDPHLHEAIQQEASDQPAGYVTRVTRVGYQLQDRVIRPSQVFVSTGPTSSP